MKFFSDCLLQNLKLKKSVLVWKTLFFLSLVASLFYSFFSAYTAFKPSGTSYRPYIGRLKIEGFITKDQERDKKILQLAQNKSVKALILHVDSPGGTIVGGESLYNSLRKFASQKPLVVVMDNIAASGGYMISLAADYIVAHAGTMTGSVGVIMQFPDLSGLAKSLGVGMTTIRSGNLKGGPSIVEGASAQERSALQDSLCVAYDYFRSLVMERRKIKKEDFKDIATGKIFVGKQALESSLVDKIGDELDAIEWLNQTHQVSGVVKDIKLSEQRRLTSIIGGAKSWKSIAAERYLKSNGILAVVPFYITDPEFHPSIF